MTGLQKAGLLALLAISIVALGSSARFGRQQPVDKVMIKAETAGTGRLVHDGDIVTISYTGTLDDGTKFDTTEGRDPYTFILGAGQAIKGWDQGLEGMKEGGTRDLTVPPALGYGDKAAGPIPANSVLHLSVTLIRIEPPEQKDVVVKGAGPKAKFGDIVSVYMEGGVKGAKPIFNSKQDEKEPAKIRIGMRELPIGFSAALLGMQKGETLHVLIPPELAYKDKGLPPTDDQKGHPAGSVIPPNSTLDFKIEMVEIQATAATG